MSKPGSDKDADTEVSLRYRRIAREEPPADLDAAILAAARREVSAGPRKRMHAWEVPLSLAAVIVLSVSLVSLMNERDDAGPETPTPRAPVADAPSSADAPSRKPAVTDSAASSERDSAADRRAIPAPAAPAQRSLPEEPVSASGAREPATAPFESRRSATPDRERRSRFETEEQGNQAKGNTGGKTTPEIVLPPAEWLAKISELRRAGKLLEADRSLAEFRRRYPDYPLPEDLRLPP